jgi:hypothetical protein
MRRHVGGLGSVLKENAVQVVVNHDRKQSKNHDIIHVLLHQIKNVPNSAQEQALELVQEQEEVLAVMQPLNDHVENSPSKLH